MSERSQVVVSHIHPIDGDLPIVNIIETPDQGDYGAFATPRLSNECNCLAWMDLQVETSEHPVILSCGVSEPDIVELDLAFELLRVNHFVSSAFLHMHGSYLSRSLEYCEYFLCCSGSLADIGTELISLTTSHGAEVHGEYANKHFQGLLFVVPQEKGTTVKESSDTAIDKELREAIDEASEVCTLEDFGMWLLKKVLVITHDFLLVCKTGYGPIAHDRVTR